MAWLWLSAGLTAHAQDGVDVQRRLLDGGDWVFLPEPRLGVPWSAAVTGAWNVGRELAVLETSEGVAVLLPSVATTEGTASFVCGSVARVGSSVVRHQGPGVPAGWGDVALWASFPVTDQDGEGIEGTWTVQYDAPTGRQPLLAGPGALRGTLTGGGELGPDGGRWAGSVGLELHREVPLPGTVWQDAWHLGVGYRLPVGPMRWGAEAVARWPARILRPDPLDVPAEGALVMGLAMGDHVLLQSALGTGWTRGLGAPSLRAVASVDVRPRTVRDRDADGVPDARDACRRAPEDRDGHRDQDGCPDLDNDGDGRPDREDRCPNRAENDNGIDDEDGCPEAAMWLELTVEASVEAVEVQMGDATWTQPVHVTVPHIVRGVPLQTLTVRASGHQDATVPFDGLGRERVAVRVTLQPVASPVQVRDGQLVLPTPLTFARNAVEAEDRDALEAVHAWLLAHPEVRLWVVGRADPPGSASYNLDLSQRRAAGVVAWLVAHGIDAERLEAVGLGEEEAQGVDPSRQVGFRVVPVRKDLGGH